MVLFVFSGIRTHSSYRYDALHDPWPSGRGRWWPQSIDQPQNLGEQKARHGDLSHLECDEASVGHDLRADLDEFLPPASPTFARLWILCAT
jgi:hypothetical protein